MLLAYIDEVGETGAFVSKDHDRYRTSPAFGYAGFILPEDHARPFGSVFTNKKRTLFRTELETCDEPSRWERKGASMFRRDTPDKFPQYIRVFKDLVGTLSSHNGHLFYYADEKPLGTPKQTHLDVMAREAGAMRECLNRLARYADQMDQNVLVLIDQVNEKQRAERLPRMYAHILGRAGGFPEMRRLVEPPMHIDSQVSSNIQFADWVAAIVSRAIDYQLVKDSHYSWVANGCLRTLNGKFTTQSKLHLNQRDIGDLHHYDILRADRPVLPSDSSVFVGLDPDMRAKLHRMHAKGSSVTPDGA